jgi:serine/threonine protein kinase
VKLSDFGWARYMNKNDLDYILCGTKEYFAPEVLKGLGHGP